MCLLTRVHMKLQISKCLIALITPFLVHRSTSNLALTTIYVYLAHDEQRSTGVITAVLLGVTSVVVYSGLVIVGFQKDWDVMIDPGPVEDLDSDGAVNVIQQWVHVGKPFA